MEKTIVRQLMLLNRSQIQIINDLLNITIFIGEMSKDIEELNSQLSNSSLEGNFLGTLLKRVFWISRFFIQITKFLTFLACARQNFLCILN